MKIWVDISNAPHVSFFKDFIHEWQAQGHSVIVTARNLSGSLELLKLHNIDYKEIGAHYGASKIQKLKGLLIRCIQLRKYLADKNVDVAVSQSSFYSPIVARLLGIRSVYTNDNEYAKGNLLANIFASKVIYPESMKELSSKSFFSRKFDYYPGTKEGIYLSYLNFARKEKPSEILNVCIRPEPWTAQYHQRDDKSLVSLLNSFDDKINVTILPRDKSQQKFFESLNKQNIHVLSEPLSLEEIYAQFDFFIGAGGSMSRELAYLGLPCLSIYQGDLLSVDRYLIAEGVMHHEKAPTIQTVEEIFSLALTDTTDVKLSEQGKQARKVIMNAVTTL